MKMIGALILVFCLAFVFMLIVLGTGPMLEWFIKPPYTVSKPSR